MKQVRDRIIKCIKGGTAMRRIINKLEGRKVLSVVLALVMVLSMMPIIQIAVSAASAPDTRVTDPSTLDGWKDIFLPNPLDTAHAGGVWTDKSVMKDASALGHPDITLDGTDNESFLVALSTMASTLSITGQTSAPIDMMLVLDVSGSMNGEQGNNDAAADLVDAANESIQTLLDANPKNRVGVVLYSGLPNGYDVDTEDVTLFLPLGRYTTGSNGQYLTYADKSGYNDDYEDIALSNNVYIEGTTRKPTAVTKYVWGATYIQKGVHLAMQQFTATTNETTVDGVARMPAMVLMSDGSPTLSSTNFTNPGSYNLGNGQSSSTSAAQGFVTQLTAAYAKTQIEAKYDEDLLFYTLGFKVDEGSIAESVLDPAHSVTGIDDFWTEYNAATVGDTVTVESTGEWQNTGTWREPNWEWVVTSTKDVTKISTALSQNYVTKYFEATGDLTAVFDDIMDETLLQAKYHPTLVETHEDLDGYISFVDKIGHYMNVTDVKGIMIHDDLFSGVDLASNFVTGGGDLGTVESPTALGNEMVHAVQYRLGIHDIDTARTLIQLAYQYGQLSYNETTGAYSNYIGWYANAAGEYLGFYQPGVTTIPEATGNADTDPVYTVKSYGYLGEVDATHGVSESDMMYATVQVRHNIQTGDEMVTFAVPAALIPIVHYDVTLDENGDLDKLETSGATEPIRLVYEVALADTINEITVHDPAVVDPAYVAANANADGSVNFYTNQYEVDNTTGYGKVNTYSYFRPSTENSQYYYTENATIYTDQNGTVYTGATTPNGNHTYYRAHTDYTETGLDTHYHPIAADVLAIAEPVTAGAADSQWYIPQGTVHVNLDGYTLYKSQNNTGTLTETFGNADPSDDKGIYDQPFVDVFGHNVADTNHRFVVGATLGNNGRLSVTPATGIEISKALTAGTPADTTTDFEFVISGSAADIGESYDAIRFNGAAGTSDPLTVTFGADAKTTVTLKAGERLFITGMTDGRTYTITENDTVSYVLATVNGSATAIAANVTVQGGELVEAAFVNEPRGTGTLTVSKLVDHDLGTGVDTSNLSFDITVTLSGIGTANQTFDADLSSTSGMTSVTTNNAGVFNVTLKDGEQIEVFGLPNGTVATVEERVPGAGFTAGYLVNGEQAATGTVTIDGTSSVVVTNTYEADPVPTVNVAVTGRKTLVDANGNPATWNNGQTFDIRLERYKNGGWEEVDTVTVDNQDPTFTFDLSGEVFDAPGRYAYQLYEVQPNAADKTPGLFYDSTYHTFSVIVSDDLTDGELDIVSVVSDHTGNPFSLVSGVWQVATTGFTNVQYPVAPALLEIAVQKQLTNLSGSPLVSEAGFGFGVYADAACTTPLNTGNGIWSIDDHAYTDSVGEMWIDMQFNAAGDYTFYIKEVAGSTAKMDYSERVVQVDVTVTANDPKLRYEVSAPVFTVLTNDDGTAAATGTAATNTDGELVFTNVYDPAAATVPVDLAWSINKVLNGRDMNAGEFTFELHSYDPYTRATNKLADGTNGAATNGNAAPITFNKTLTFDKVGTYYYVVFETSTDGNGITVDKTAYHVMVTVTDVNGQLTATHTVVDVTGNEMVFTNTYTATPTTADVTGTKTLTGRVLLNDEFTFVLTESDQNGDSITGGRTFTTTNMAPATGETFGRFAFNDIPFDTVGEYYFTVTEKQNDIAYGIDFDKTEYLVKITVTDDELGALSAAVEVVGATAIAFTNTYDPAATSAEIPGNKVLEGRVWNGDIFSFELYASNSTWVQGSWIETVQNDVNGAFNFTKIGRYDATENKYLLDTAGDYYYIVKETNGGTQSGGVFYDPTVYRVWIEVTDDLIGQLHATVHVYNGDGVPQTGVQFTNVYRVVEGDTVTIDGTKTLTGNKTLEDDMFTFELYEADDTYTAGTKLDSVKNTADAFAFTIEYAPDDIRTEPYYYVVKEKNAGQTIDGITYSDQTYRVKITVSDDLNGKVTTDVVIENGPIAFVNEYKAAAATTEIDGEKTLTGRDLVAGEFTFSLYESDATGTRGTLAETTQNDANGDFTLDSFNFETAGTYYFVIAEKTDVAIANVTFDQTAYLVKITVKDDGQGQLKLDGDPVITKVGATGDAQLAFTNVYTPPTTTPPTTSTTEPAPTTPPTTTATPTTPTTSGNPQTGNARSVAPWIALMLLSGSGLVATLVYGKRKETETA